MAPRSYRLSRRAETSAATRRRILDAAVETYRDLGMAGATLTAVAARADVARGTILHHFGSAEGLLSAVLDEILARLQVPDEGVLEGIEDPEDRIRAFVEAMVAFQERSAPWWELFAAEMHRPEFKKRDAAYWEAFARLQAVALGPELASNPAAGAAIVALSHPATAGTFAWAFERAGADVTHARRLIGDLAIDAIRRIGGAGGGSDT